MPRNYRSEKPERKTYEQVVNRVNYLRSLNEPYMTQRSRIRKLANGGAQALDVLLKDLETNDDTELAVNHIKSGLERFSEMIGLVPDLRVDPPDHKDNSTAARAAEKRERIVNSYDEHCNLEGQLEQASLWLPGYGFTAWKVREATDRNGYKYPKAELRDPYTTWPAEWGVDQQPDDIAFQRYVQPETLVAIYPRAKAALDGRKFHRLPGGGVDLSPFATHRHSAQPGWDGVLGGIEVIEYVDSYGTYVLSPAIEGFLDVYEHPLPYAPFVVAKRTAFDRQQGQFDDAIGAASAIAKATLLQRIAMEDAVFAPVVVTGRMDGPFRKGRDAVNVIEGGDAKYLYQNIPYQAFAEVERIEGYLRTATGYSKQVDGESPISFVTGQGLEELGSSISRQVERYHALLRRTLERLDTIRLEWDEVAYGRERKPLEGVRKGAIYSEEYTPATDIDGNYRTRRVYGLMAGMDEARKTVGLLQLQAAKDIDRRTVQENLRGIDNVQKVNDRIVAEQAETTLFETLSAMASQGDRRMAQALLRIMENPEKLSDILDEVFAAEEAQVAAAPSPEEQYSQVLTRLTAGGQPQGGAQTLTRVGG